MIKENDECNLYKNIPADLKSLRRWVVYKKEDKIPRKIDGTCASVVEPQDWTDFKTACQAPFDGIGFVFTKDDPYCGIDLDDCVENGGVKDWALKVIDKFNSYAEFSPSQTGIHIIVKGKLDKGHKRGAIECYGADRYFTFTGNTLNGLNIEERSKELEEFCKESFLEEKIPPLQLCGKSVLTDDEVIEKAIKAANHEKFIKLYELERWESDYPSRSEADLALCSILAFWTNRDPESIDRIFRTSSLMRDKWDSKRGDSTYGQDTVAKAIAQCRETYSLEQKVPEIPFETYSKLPALSLTEFLQQDIPPVEYIVEDVLQKGGKTIVSAGWNVGKSMFLQNLGVLMGKAGGEFIAKFKVLPCKVLYLDTEMGNSALYQRFKTMCPDGKADNLIIKCIPTMNILDSLCQKWLEALLQKYSINVLMLDPLGACHSADENNRQEVNQVTGYLNTLISKYGIGIIAAHHWRKAAKGQKQGGEMMAGSYGWGAWLDNHITLSGTPESITVSCDKSRNRPKFAPFRAKLNPETLWIEYAGDYEVKYTQDTLIRAYEVLCKETGLSTVLIADLKKYAKKNDICSEATIKRLIQEDQEDEDSLFIIEKTTRKQTITKKSCLLA